MTSNIVIGFSRAKSRLNPYSLAIRLVQGTPYSHTYIRFYSESYERELVYQASGLYVNFDSKANFDSKELVIREFVVPVSLDTKKKIVQFAIDQVGDPYDIVGVLGLALVKMSALVGLTIKNPFRTGDNTYFCSKIVSHVLEEYKGISMGNPDNVTPQDAYNILAGLNFQSP